MNLRRRDPRQFRFLTIANLRWVLRHRAWTPRYLVRYARLWRLRMLHPEVVTEGMVFLGRGVKVFGRPGYGRVILGSFVHIGDETHIRAHEGTVRIGDKAVLGRHTTVNCYLDIEIGARTLIADWVHITDFDHRFDDPVVPIKDQGIAKAPVRIGPDCWLGVKVTVVRGSMIGSGTVVGANSVVRNVLPERVVAGGIPARVLRPRVGELRRPQARSSAAVSRRGSVRRLWRLNRLARAQPDGADRRKARRKDPLL